MDSVVRVVQYFRCNVGHQGAVSALRGGGSERTGGGVDQREGVEATAASASRLSHTIQAEAASWWQSYGRFCQAGQIYGPGAAPAQLCRPIPDASRRSGEMRIEGLSIQGPDLQEVWGSQVRCM